MDVGVTLDFVCLDTGIVGLDAQDPVHQPTQSICAAIYMTNAIDDMVT